MRTSFIAFTNQTLLQATSMPTESVDRASVSLAAISSVVVAERSCDVIRCSRTRWSESR
jgi:hypothetical protein